MRFLKISALFSILSSLLTPFSDSQTGKSDFRGFLVSVGDQSPNFSLQYFTGEKITLQDLAGKIVMLQFTASWCSACREEMPHIEKEIWQKYKNLGLVVIGIDRDEPLEVVKNFAKDMKITYPLALDPDADIFGLFADKESGVTRNVILNRKGKIVFLARLYDPEEFNQMKELIAELLTQ